jgi:hypothetical protein
MTSPQDSTAHAGSDPEEEPFLALAGEGERRLRLGDRAGAIEAFQDALQRGSTNLPALSVVNSQLGSCYYQQVGLAVTS